MAAQSFYGTFAVIGGLDDSFGDEVVSEVASEQMGSAGQPAASEQPSWSWSWSPSSRSRSWHSQWYGTWGDWDDWDRYWTRWESNPSADGAVGSRGEDRRSRSEQVHERREERPVDYSHGAEQGSLTTTGVSTEEALRQEPVVEVGYGRGGELPTGEVRSLGGAGQEDPECEKAEKTRGKVSSSYPPIFRAKPGESYAEWKRAVHFWVGGEGDQLPMCYRGPRLMVQLRDRAAQLVRHLDLKDVQKSSGMELIFKTLEASPLVKQMDKHKVDQHRRILMALDRVPGESLESYITRAYIYRVQLQALDESLAMGERFYVGHLLDHARLSRKDKAMVRTRSACETEQEVTSAMLDLASELEGEHGYPIGLSEPNMAGHQGEEFLVQKSSTYRRPTAPRAALLAMGDHAEELDETMSTEAGDGSESVDEEAIPELIEAEKEAYALQFRAKQRMAEVKKMRHFYQKRDPEERKRELAEKMKETHCHTCGEKGHWSRECPKKRAQQVLMASNAGKPQTARPKQRAALQGIPEGIQADQEWDLLVPLFTDSFLTLRSCTS